MNLLIGIAVVAPIALSVYVDARLLRWPNDPQPTLHPVGASGWALSVLLFGVVYYPWYLVERRRLVNKRRTR